MPLTTTQSALLRAFRCAVLELPDRRIVYCSEYLGYLPFGLYHWVIADGRNIPPAELPWEFSSADFEALEREGLLRRVDEWINPEDELEKRITFEVAAV